MARPSTLGVHLEQWWRGRDLAGRVSADPVAFPRRYSNPDDKEVAGLLAATLAYGHVNAFWPMVERLLAIAGDAPAAFFTRFDLDRARDHFRSCYYRFSSSKDLLAFFHILHCHLNEHGSLRSLFASLYRPDDPDIGPLLARYVEASLAVDTSPVYGHRRKPPGLLHLFSGPLTGGASKRLCLYLRWMVRPDDGVDLGLWPFIPPSKLVLPLDAHVVRIGRYLGLSQRKSPGWLMAREMTEKLRRFAPDDPVKYDFALCHYGMAGECPVRPRPEHCARCALKPVCRVGRRRAPSPTPLALRERG